LSKGEGQPAATRASWLHHTAALNRAPGFEDRRAIDWVIVGGESGPGARPMHPDWARSLRDECQAAGVAFFFKQWGEWVESRAGERFDAVLHPDGHRPDRYDRTHPVGSVFMRRVGKKAAGRLLDGRTWDELPVKAAARA
jgi:protein gp37